MTETIDRGIKRKRDRLTYQYGYQKRLPGEEREKDIAITFQS